MATNANPKVFLCSIGQGEKKNLEEKSAEVNDAPLCGEWLRMCVCVFVL